MVYININIIIYTTVTYAAKIFICMIYYIYCAKWVVFSILLIYIAQTCWYILVHQCTMHSICMVNRVSLDLPCRMDEFM